ncbi:MAG: YcbK family protein [Gemmatimonadota bacterium]
MKRLADVAVVGGGLLVGALLVGVAFGGRGPLEPALPAAPAPAPRGPDPGMEVPRTVEGLFLGQSGSLRFVQVTAGEPIVDPLLKDYLAPLVGRPPGVYDIGLHAPDGDRIAVLSLVPFRAKIGPALKGYSIGFWPDEARRTRSPRYPLPQGFVEVTRGNQFTKLSKRFELKDFVTKDQGGVWPKFVVIDQSVVDKLELISDELTRMGRPSRVVILSGFRTPEHNRTREVGGASDSRHMYGDAADIIIDQDRDGIMDDLNRDGRSDWRDARLLGAVIERVESFYPDLKGGLGVYPGSVHTDTRGVRARW